VISQLLLALPTWVLFEFGVVMARLVEKKADYDDEASEESNQL
jgi:Sec-independent protein secretion pathway component TatC